ncbi:MAG TPA: trehalose-6-phosphate synthase, partial [Chitinophagaceae bacterium]
MKLNLALVLSIIIGVGLVALGFTAFQISSEREQLNNELELNTIKLAEEFYRNHLKDLERGDSAQLNLTDSIVSQYNFIGLALYYNADSIQTYNLPSKQYVQVSADYIAQALSADSSMSNLIKAGGDRVHEYIRIVYRKDLPAVAAVFYTDADYITNIINSIWLRNFLRWFLQALVICIVTLLIVRWGILNPLNKVVEWVKAARSGNIDELRTRPPNAFLAPLYKEISGIARAMQEAKATAQEEAKLRTTAESIWTPERLNEEMKQVLQNKKLVVVSNREPYMHIRSGREINVIMPASGMVTALEPILKACGGLWIASGSGDADRETVDENDKILVPPYEGKYTLRRVWLTKEQENHFYYGFSNEGLWPLCHIA